MQTLIPPRAYHDPTTLALEQKRLFSHTWICVGMDYEVTRPDDFIVRNVAGHSVVIQNFDGELKAFLNVCSHRFNRLQTQSCGNRALQCGYHGWTFDKDGIPSKIPKRPRFDDLTPEKACELRLPEWRLERCGQLLFICRDPKIPPLKDFLGASFARIEAMTNACGELIDENVMEIRANWKILIENTLESYHVGFIHPTTFSRLNAGEGEFSWQGPHSSWDTPLGNKFKARMERVMSVFDSRPLKLNGYFHQLIFPYVTLASTQGTSFSVQFFEPLSPSLTRFRSLVFSTRLDSLSPGQKPIVAVMNNSVKEFNRTVFSEDKDVCENVHLGTIETERLGLLSDEEKRVGEFQRHYMQAMEPGK